MERMLILNASPRAPRSNSKVYAQMLAHGWGGPAAYREVLSPAAFPALRQELEQAAHLVLVFPLYADSLPVPLVRFLKELEANPPAARPVVSVAVNCGFLEPQQNDLAVEMVHLVCRRNGYPFGSVLEIASGEAILGTPFRFLVDRACRRMARSIRRGQHRPADQFLHHPDSGLCDAGHNVFPVPGPHSLCRPGPPGAAIGSEPPTGGRRRRRQGAPLWAVGGIRSK